MDPETIMNPQTSSPLQLGYSGNQLPVPTISDPLTGWISQFSLFANNVYILESVKLLILGSLTASLFETARRLWQWLIGRFKFQYAISARFDEGDPAYEWIILLLTQDHVWEASRNFRVTSKSSARKWGVKTGDPHDRRNAEYAEYVPTYEESQLFRWKGYWVEVRKAVIYDGQPRPFGPAPNMNSLVLRLFTFKMSVLSDLVEDARQRYVEINRPNVTIHLVDAPNYAPWTNVKRKFRRPLNSIILQEGVIDSLLKDAQDFLRNEDWYIETGIPHRRGYLLFGPPGTGKTSTIYALAGELGLEIYSLSLSSQFVDDMFLQRAASSIPKSSIFLIEDIDCAFSSREEEEEQMLPVRHYPSYLPGKRSAVSLSGLLNVIDGVGSEEGKLFFATTNYIDRLDSALMRPGRIDVKIQYKLSTQFQAKALFQRFFPESRFKGDLDLKSPIDVAKLADEFGALIPENEFSTAALQGYLLVSRKDPVGAVAGITAWIEKERVEKREREERARRRKEKVLAQRMSSWANMQKAPGLALPPVFLDAIPETPSAVVAKSTLAADNPEKSAESPASGGDLYGATTTKDVHATPPPP